MMATYRVCGLVEIFGKNETKEIIMLATSKKHAKGRFVSAYKNNKVGDVLVFEHPPKGGTIVGSTVLSYI